MNHLTAQRKEITKFILMTFLWSWFFWIGTAILTTQNAIKQGQFFYRVFHILGGSGPTIIALYCAIAKKPKGSLRAFFKTWLPSGTTNIGILILLAFIFYSISQPIMLWLLGETDGLLVTNWPLMLALFPLMIIGGGLEEAGWRGIVYDDSKYLQIGKVWAIAAMGIVWSIWHSPLWFIPGTYQNMHMDFISFVFSTCSISFFLYALRITGASVGWCIIAHTLSNTLLGIFVSCSNTSIVRGISFISLLITSMLFIFLIKIRSQRNRVWQ